MKKSISSEKGVLTLPDEKYEELERLSALGYSEAEMAMYYDVPEGEFRQAAIDPTSEVNYHIRRGVLMSGALEQMGLLGDAEKGNVQAIQMLYKVRYRRQFEVAKRELLYNLDIDEKVFQRLESYIESGSLADLKPDEAIYIELLTMINAMRRKFGRVKTIKFFCKKPFEFTYAQSRDMYEQAINLFYVDSKVEKKAMRNLKAEQLEEAAEMVREMATKPEDFEVYGKLMKLSAEIRQLNLPDPPEVPVGTFDRPYKVYTLNPELIGIDKPNRNDLARQIDSIVGATEAEKEKAKQDAGIVDVIPLDNILDEYEEENKYKE